jgi:hypothetical protein
MLLHVFQRIQLKKFYKILVIHQMVYQRKIVHHHHQQNMLVLIIEMLMMRISIIIIHHDQNQRINLLKFSHFHQHAK